MTVFKSFWKVVSKYKVTIILYTVMLIVFGAINMSTSDNNINFENSKPDVLIIDEDNSKISNNLVKYFSKNSNIIDVNFIEENINDALFYRDVNYVIYIPNNYGKDVLSGEDPEIKVKSTGDYQASLANIMLERYLKLQNVYKSISLNDEDLVNKINNNFNTTSNVILNSKLDINATSILAFYFNFASYSLMAVIVFIICLVMTSFKNKAICKRTIVSGMNYKSFNKKLLASSFLYSFIVWLLFVILSFIILGDAMFSIRGILYILNLFIFSFSSLSIALFISTLVNNKEAISGIVNVVALGSAFLCGAFVPAEWLPKFVLKIAHVLPSYYFINSNDLLKKIENINFVNLRPIIFNSIVLVLFALLFIVLNNFVSRNKQRYYV